jgi:hypothetical protein
MSITKLELRTALGPVYRDVLPHPPRDCTPHEIPVIDLEPMSSGELCERKKVSSAIKAAAVNTGFFYVKNHGIAPEIIARCKEQLVKFMRQPLEMKDLVSSHKYSKFYNGYIGSRRAQISPGETADVRESFAFRYSPELDPDHPKDMSELPNDVRHWIRGEDFVWEGTKHLADFKKDCLAYWASCLTLARKLVRMFALSLDLDEDYWDEKVTYPGAECAVYIEGSPFMSEQPTNLRFLVVASSTTIRQGLKKRSSKNSSAWAVILTCNSSHCSGRTA